MTRTDTIETVTTTIETQVSRHTLRDEIAASLQQRFVLDRAAAQKLAKAGQYAAAYGARTENLRDLVDRHLN